MTTSNQRKAKRKKLLKELARQSILKFAPEPITREELEDWHFTCFERMLIAAIRQAMYFKPGQTIQQRTHDNVPKKSIKQLLKEYEERINNKT